MADDLLKKIAANFAELSEREHRMMKERFGIDMVRLPSIQDLGQTLEAVRGKLRAFEERSRQRRAADDGAQSSPPPG